MKKFLLILGANSDIAKALSREYARNGYNLFLAGRNVDDLKKESSDISLEFNVDVKYFYFDVLDTENHKKFYESLSNDVCGVICAVGYLGNQFLSEDSFNETRKIIDTNFTGVVSILNEVSKDFEQKKQGFIIAIGSVAGDRGRRSNCLYGSSKAALSEYLSGLRARLFKSDVHVLTVKPGFVSTKMVKDLKLPKLLTATPEQVAKDIFKAHKAKKDIIYTLWFWQFIMLIVKLIPEKLFKRISL